jgi:hypothetical protein
MERESEILSLLSRPTLLVFVAIFQFVSSGHLMAHCGEHGLQRPVGGRGQRGGIRHVRKNAVAMLAAAVSSAGCASALAFCPAGRPANLMRPGPPVSSTGAPAGACGKLAPSSRPLSAALGRLRGRGGKAGTPLALRMQAQESDRAEELLLRGGPGVGSKRLGSAGGVLERTRQWFESSTLMGELTTDDGIPVSELAPILKSTLFSDFV